MDYRKPDYNQARPDSDQFNLDWQKSSVIEIDSNEPRLQAVVDSLRHTNIHGGALLARFRIEAEPGVAWFLTRNRLPEASFFTKFFNHEVVRQRFAAPLTDNAVPHDLGFGLEARFVAVARLAEVISNGGAYLHFEGSDSEVLALANAFTDAAFDNRYRDTQAYVSWEPWSPWFKGIAWDASFFWLDKKTGTATVLLITDTD